MNDYWKMMTGAKAKHKKKPEEVRELTQVEPVQVTPEVVGPIHEPLRTLPSAQDAFLDSGLFDRRALDGAAMDPHDLRRLSDAARTGETTIEMRECVARTDGRIKARTVEVSISYGERLSLGELLKGCLSIMDHSRRGFGRAVALPPPAYIDAEARRVVDARVEELRNRGASMEPLDSPFRALEQPRPKGLGYKKA